MRRFIFLILCVYLSGCASEGQTRALDKKVTEMEQKLAAQSSGVEQKVAKLSEQVEELRKDLTKVTEECSPWVNEVSKKVEILEKHVEEISKEPTLEKRVNEVKERVESLGQSNQELGQRLSTRLETQEKAQTDLSKEVKEIKKKKFRVDTTAYLVIVPLCLFAMVAGFSLPFVTKINFKELSFDKNAVAGMTSGAVEPRR